MLRVYREPCNFSRYHSRVQKEETYLTEWGDATVELTVKNMMPTFEKAGFWQVHPHSKLAARNDTLKYIMALLNISFGFEGVHSTGNAAEAYMFHTLQSADEGDYVAAENLFFIGMYALLVT